MKMTESEISAVKAEIALSLAEGKTAEDAAQYFADEWFYSEGESIDPESLLSEWIENGIISAPA